MKLVDNCNIKESMTIEELTAKPQKTKIIIKNHVTGEVLGEYENKVVVHGSALNAAYAFGLEYPKDNLPTYNKLMNFDNDVEKTDSDIRKVCLFCISDGGCGNKNTDVYATKYTDMLKAAPAGETDESSGMTGIITKPDPTDENNIFKPDMIMPFRYVDKNSDIGADLRKYYYGRKEYNYIDGEVGTTKIGYYFKKFDTEPQLHLQYADGSQITESIYNIQSDQIAECYVECRLRINRLDFRDYFENVIGWDKSRISALSLCHAWAKTGNDGNTYYYDITPYTVLKFPFKWLTDENIALDILYQIYY